MFQKFQSFNVPMFQSARWLNFETMKHIFEKLKHIVLQQSKAFLKST